MKKLFLLALSLLLALCAMTVCHAGDIPEGLLTDADAQVYFGEIKSVVGSRVTVIQRQNIKGEFTQDLEITYKEFGFTENPEAGLQYLCGFLDENNPLYIWDVTGFDTSTLEIKQTDELSQRMQEYLNEGKFEEQEQARLLAIEEAETSDLPTEAPASAPPAQTQDRPPAAAPAQAEQTVPVLVWIGCGAALALLAVLFWKKRKR